VATLSPFLFFLILGVALLALELVIFQFSSFWLFFIGIGSLVAALWAWLAPGSGLPTLLAVFVIASVAVTALLLQPLRRWQSQPTGLEDNNAIGQRVKVISTISPGQPGKVFWSGSDWPADLADGEQQSLAAGSHATVVKVSGIRLLVSAGTGG
jgi:membrane protein implicated in regulation of membrane protease activity